MNNCVCTFLSFFSSISSSSLHPRFGKKPMQLTMHFTEILFKKRERALLLSLRCVRDRKKKTDNLFPDATKILFRKEALSISCPPPPLYTGISFSLATVPVPPSYHIPVVLLGVSVTIYKVIDVLHTYVKKVSLWPGR